ncbi:MAG: CPBP family intramembrane metalloprotease [Oscillospiraceae bacterium]|nr:CPBP family intramembrane metalloprotease [Oscillospiraceae bacterium]
MNESFESTFNDSVPNTAEVKNSRSDEQLKGVAQGNTADTGLSWSFSFTPEQPFRPSSHCQQYPNPPEKDGRSVDGQPQQQLPLPGAGHPSGAGFVPHTPPGFTPPNAEFVPHTQGTAFPMQGFTQYTAHTPPGYPAPPVPPYPAPYPCQPVIHTVDPNTKGRCFPRSLVPLLIYFATQIIAGIVYFAFELAQNPYLFNLHPEKLTKMLLDSFIFQSMLISSFFCIAAMLLLYRMEMRIIRYFPGSFFLPKKPFALNLSGEKSPFLLFPVVAIISVGANILVASGIAILENLTIIPQTIDHLFGSGPAMPELGSGLFLVMLLGVGIVVPIAEELCFRLMMFNHLRRGFGLRAANLIQAAVFGLVHGHPIQICYAFALGLFLGWAYERSRRIWIPVAIHISFNLAGVIVPYVREINSILSNGIVPLILALPAAAIVITGLLACNEIFNKTAKS